MFTAYPKLTPSLQKVWDNKFGEDEQEPIDAGAGATTKPMSGYKRKQQQQPDENCDFGSGWTFRQQPRKRVSHPHLPILVCLTPCLLMQLTWRAGNFRSDLCGPFIGPRSRAPSGSLFVFVCSTGDAGERSRLWASAGDAGEGARPMRLRASAADAGEGARPMRARVRDQCGRKGAHGRCGRGRARAADGDASCTPRSGTPRHGQKAEAWSTAWVKDAKRYTKIAKLSALRYAHTQLMEKDATPHHVSASP